MSRLIDADVLIDKLPLEYIGSTMHGLINEQPEVQLSPIEQALHGLSPEEQADYLENLMLKTWCYTDSRAALVRWLERGDWNERY